MIGRRHDIGTGAGVEGLHLDRRIIDFGQCRERQKPIRRTCPTSMIAAISSDVATGRRMNMREGLIGDCRLTGLGPPTPTLPSGSRTHGRRVSGSFRRQGSASPELRSRGRAGWGAPPDA